MRLLKLVPCGRSAVADEEPPDSTPSATPEKHRRRNSPVRAATTWQPSLGAISEDGALFLSPAKSAPSPPGKPGKYLEKRRARRRAAARHGEDKGGFRHHDAQAGIPAFAPTLFMF